MDNMMRDNLKIGFYGATGSYDFGDFCMMVCNIKCLYELNSNIHIIIFTPDIEKTKKCIQINVDKDDLKNRIDYVSDEIIQSNLFDKFCSKAERLTRGKYKVIVNTYVRKRLHKRADKCWRDSLKTNVLYKKFPDSLIESLSSINVMVFNGGGYLQNAWGYRNINFMTYINLCHGLNKPIYFLGNSFGPFKEMYIPYIQKSLGFVEKILIRDGKKYSYKRLNNLNIGTDKLIVNTDDLIFENRVKSKHNPYVVVEIMWLIVGAKEGMGKILDELIVFVKYLIQRGYKIVLPLFDVDDNIAMRCYRYIVDKVENSDSIYIHENVLNIEEMFLIYANASFSVSMKYHPVILSLANNVPCIGIICGNDGYYDSKIRGAYESLEVKSNDKVIALDDLTANKLIYMFKNVSLMVDTDKIFALKKTHMDLLGEITGITHRAFEKG